MRWELEVIAGDRSGLRSAKPQPVTERAHEGAWPARAGAVRLAPGYRICTCKIRLPTPSGNQVSDWSRFGHRYADSRIWGCGETMMR
jgi:hypothetical protein